MRGRSNYLVQVYEDDDTQIYGPYTQKQAIAVVACINAFYKKEAEACDEEYDEGRPFVSRYRIGRWKPREMLTAPKRPPCPSCGVKLNIWTSNFGDEGTHGSCQNRQCEDYNKVDHMLTEVDGKWVIINS